MYVCVYERVYVYAGRGSGRVSEAEAEAGSGKVDSSLLYCWFSTVMSALRSMKASRAAVVILCQNTNTGAIVEKRTEPSSWNLDAG